MMKNIKNQKNVYKSRAHVATPHARSDKESNAIKGVKKTQRLGMLGTIDCNWYVTIR